MSARQLERIDALVEGGGDADDILRNVVGELAREPGHAWAGIYFLEQGAFELGPASGTPDKSRRTGVPIAYQETVVGELAVDGDANVSLLEQVAARISAHVLLGWDTGGESWVP
jgi:hypothetical protein